jgi:CHASE2 domain-containing sensor protein
MLHEYARPSLRSRLLFLLCAAVFIAIWAFVTYCAWSTDGWMGAAFSFFATPWVMIIFLGIFLPPRTNPQLRDAPP